jgi:hypothetical protein
MARPRATLLIPDPASPYRTLEIRGDVEITPTRTTASPGASARGMAGPTSDPRIGQASRV